MFSFRDAGAVAWVFLDERRPYVDLDTLQLTRGAQVIISGSTKNVLNISRVNDDGSSFLYTSSAKILYVRQHLGPCTILYNASSLVLASDKSTAFKVDRTVNVFGDFEVYGSPLLSLGQNGEAFKVFPLSAVNNIFVGGLTLGTSGVFRLYSARAETVCLWNVNGTTSSQFKFLRGSSFHVHCPVYLHGSVLSIEQDSELVFYGVGRSVISLEHAVIKGSLKASSLEFEKTRWKSLAIYPRASLSFYTYDRVLNITNSISIDGVLNANKQLLIYTTDFNLGYTGRLEWNGTEVAKLEAENVFINSRFIADQKTIGRGWKTLTIGPKGKLSFNFSLHGEIKVDELVVQGKLVIEGPTTIRGFSRNTTQLISIAEGASVEINTKQSNLNSSDELTNATVLAESVIVNGIWSLKNLKISQGWKSLTVGSKGKFSFDANGDFPVGKLIVQGALLIGNVVVFKGRDSPLISLFSVETNGKVEFDIYDSTINGSGSQKITSKLLANVVNVKGTWVARRLAIEPGWDSLTVGVTAFLQCLPTSDFKMNTLNVKGELSIEGAVNFAGRNKTAISSVIIETGAKMFFDLPLTRSYNNSHGVSEMVADEVVIRGTWIANKLRIKRGWKSLTVDPIGKFSLLPVGDFPIANISVFGQLLVNSTITLLGSQSRNSKFEIGPKARVEFDLPVTIPHVSVNASGVTLYSVIVRGTWIAHKLTNKFRWNKLVIDTLGVLRLLPIGLFPVDSVTVNGHLFVQNTIFLRGIGNFVIGPQAFVEFGLKPLTQHTITGNISKVEYRSVIVQGTWKPKKLSILSGWRNLLIDQNGLLRVLPIGYFAIDEITVKGQLLVESTIALRGSKSFSVTQKARVEFDINPTVPHKPMENYSELSSYSTVTIEGSWQAQKLSIAPGWSRLFIGTQGLLRMLPVGKFNIDGIIVKGKLLVERTIKLKGKKGLKTNIRIDLGGIMRFDLNNSRPHILSSNVSEVSAVDVIVNGRWTTNKMKIWSGWQSLTIGAGAVMTVLPIGDYNITNVTINGQLLVYSRMVLRGSSTDDNSRLSIGRNAHVEFDLPYYLPHTPSKSYSVTSSYSVTVQGSWIARKLSIDRGWRQLTVETKGLLKLLPVDPYPIDSIDIKGQLLVESRIELHGKQSLLINYFTVWSGGNATFYLPPTRPDNPKNEVSQIQATTVNVNGLLSARKLKIKPGWKNLNIGQGGTVTLIPIEEYNVARVTVNGKLLVSSTITLRGDPSDISSIFVIGKNARVEYDLPTVLHHTPKQNFSETSSYSVTVKGTWIAQRLAIAPGWRNLLIETDGLLRCLPIGNFPIDSVTVKGQLLVENTIPLQGKTSPQMTSFLVAAGAKVAFDITPTKPHLPVTDTSELQSLDVTVNGIWTANKLKIGPGWKSLDIGSGAQMMVLPIGEYRVARISISGQLMVNSTITLLGSTTDANSYLKVNQGARVDFDLPTSLPHLPTRNFSEVSSYTVTVDGTWIAHNLQISPGWRSLVVGSRGFLKLLPIEDYPVDTVKVNGQFQVEKNIYFKGKHRDVVQQFTVGRSASVEFDLPATRAYATSNDTSVLLADIVTLQENSRWVARKMAVGSGWQKLSINSGAVFSLLPIGDYGIDEINVNSGAEVLVESIIVIRGRSSPLARSLTIGSRAVMKFDLTPSRKPYSPPQNFSEIRARDVSVYGTLLAQKLSIKPGWQRFFIGNAGLVRLLPVKDYPIDNVIINGRFEVECNITLHGKTSMFVSSVVLGPNSRMEFDLSPSRPNAKQNSSSEVKANTVELQSNSVWVARKMKIGLGWVKLTVGNGARFQVLPIGEYRIDDVLVRGQLSVESTVIIRGRSRELMNSFFVADGATVDFDIPQTRPNTQLQSFSEMRAVTVTINGRWHPQKLKIRPGWSSLTIGPRGVLRVLPMDVYEIDSVTVNGKFEVESTIFLRGKASNFVTTILLGPGASVQFDLPASRPNAQVNDTSIVFSDIVTLNTRAQWSARKMSIGMGWQRLTVNTLAVLSLIAVGDYPIDNVTIDGQLLVESPIVIHGRSSNLSNTLRIGNSGNVEFDIQPPSRPNTPSQDFSFVQVEDIVNNGRWTSQKLKIKPGWNSLLVGSKAYFRFLPVDTFSINRMTVQGEMLVEGTIFLRGRESLFVNAINIEAGGQVLLDQSNSRPYTRVNDTSEVLADTVTVNGKLVTQKMSIGESGWKGVSVGQFGLFEFYPMGTYRIDTITVDGILTSLRGFLLKGRSKPRTDFIRVNSKGTLTVKTRILTTIHCSRYFVSGTSRIGNLTAPPRWDDLTVSGGFYFSNSWPLNIDVIYITSTGLIQTLLPVPPKGRLWGKSLLIDNGGKLHINYQGVPIQPHFGTINSTIYMARVVVNGRLEAGSLYFVSDNFTIGSTGVIDVSNGGALSASGNGTGTSSSSGASGASHGGRGGKGAGTLAYNLPYGNIFRPGSWGSGGGNAGNARGGRGGGKIEMYITQTLEVQGTIQMDGQGAQVCSYTT